MYKKRRKEKYAVAAVILIISVVSFSGCTSKIVSTTGWTHGNQQATEVIITGKLNMGSTSMAEELWFEWKEKGSNFNSSISASGTGGSTFNAVVDNLNRVKTYQYRACVLKEGETFRGEWVDCKPGLPDVSSGEVVQVDWDEEIAIVSGKLNHLGGAGSCNIMVRYGIHDARGMHTDSISLARTGYFEIEIDDFPTDAQKWGIGWYVEVSNDVGKDNEGGSYIHPPE